MANDNKPQFYMTAVVCHSKVGGLVSINRYPRQAGRPHFVPIFVIDFNIIVESLNVVFRTKARGLGFFGLH